MELLKATMSKLVDYGLLSDAGKVETWFQALSDKTEMELREGLRKARDHRGPLSLGDFRSYCVYVPPLSERIYRPDRQLKQLKSSPETIEYYKQLRKQETGI